MEQGFGTLHPELMRAELRAGHEIGNHTYSHARLTKLAGAEIEREVKRGSDALEHAGAPPPDYFRPPWGAFDERVGLAAAAEDERMIGWDLPLDRYLEDRPARSAVTRLLGDVRPGSIVLIHAERAWRPRKTLAALFELIRELRRRGYRPVTVGTLLRAARSRSE